MTLKRQDIMENYRTVEIFRDDADGKIELIERLDGGARLIKRTYYEDKREIFGLLSKADASHLARIEEVCFDVDTVVLEEYIEGESLSGYLGHSTLSSRQAAGFIRELLMAVREVHKLGIIHRDIKPENMLIDKAGHLHLIDFGIARIYRPGKANDTQLLGTVGYAPPEQFGYAQSDFRSDIYAIGATCRDLNRVCKKSRLLRKIEKKCMKMDPEERYADASSILVEFQKNRIASLGGIACAFVLLLALGIGVYSLGQQREIEEKRGDLQSVPMEDCLFEGQDDASYLMLVEGSEKSAEISLGEKEERIAVQARLTAEGLYLSLTDPSAGKSEFMLANQYEYTEDYADTSLYAEVLFFDADSDGRDEIWVAISERKLVTLSNGETVANQNYMAGWCIYQKESGRFDLADGQLFTMGGFEIGTIVPGGVWQEFEMEGYALEDGAFVTISW